LQPDAKARVTGASDFERTVMCFFCRRVAAVFVAALSSVAPVPVNAQEGGFCAPYPLININVYPVFDQPVVDDSLPLAAIQEMAQSSRDIIPRYDTVTLGITHYEPVIEFKAPMIARSLPDGTFCSRVEQVDVVVGYRNVRIFIARELTPDPCSANHVYEHEQKHIAVNRALLQEFVPLIRDKLTAYFRLYGQFIAPNPEYASSLLREKANSILTDVSNSMLEENRRRQRMVDTPEEYARNNVVCNGWINNLIRQYKITRR